MIATAMGIRTATIMITAVLSDDSSYTGVTGIGEGVGALVVKLTETNVSPAGRL